MGRPQARACIEQFIEILQAKASRAAKVPVFISLACLLCWKAPAFGADSVTACTIRWDAWYTNGPNDPAHYTAIALSPQRWHDRIPLHGKIDASGAITWAPSQATFDAEIRVAHSGRLCWAYLMYGDNGKIDLRNPMMKALSYHRASSIKRFVSYAMIISTSVIGRTGDFESAVSAINELLADSNYQFVQTNGERRPLIFLFFDPVDLNKAFDGSLEKMKEPIDAIRTGSRRLGLGNPYIVVLLSPAKRAEEVRYQLGADAISEYISGTRRGDEESWSDFEPTIEADWDIYARVTEGAIVPTLRTGADIRARCQRPPPFERRFPPGAKCSSFVVNPTLKELVFEFQRAVSWVRADRQSDPTGLLLVYSWSECDESGNCLMPTIGDPQGRKLHVVSRALH